MNSLKYILLGIGATNALDKTFAMPDAMCNRADERPWEDKENNPGASIYVVNSDVYRPGSIEDQLNTDKPEDYEFYCMQYCLSKIAEHPEQKDYCCGYYPQDEGHVTCWLIPDDSISYNRGAHKAIMIGNEEYHRTLYNFTMTGWVDLGFTELSSSSVNDTITEVEISLYPDGVTKTQIHKSENFTSTIAPREFMPIQESFYLLVQNQQAFAEINLVGNFGTEKANAASASFNTTNIDKLGVGYGMFGFGGENPNDQSDVMLVYDVKPVPLTEQIMNNQEFMNLMMDHCWIWLFGTGFFCAIRDE